MERTTTVWGMVNISHDNTHSRNGMVEKIKGDTVTKWRTVQSTRNWSGGYDNKLVQCLQCQ